MAGRAPGPVRWWLQSDPLMRTPNGASRGGRPVVPVCAAVGTRNVYHVPAHSARPVPAVLLSDAGTGLDWTNHLSWSPCWQLGICPGRYLTIVGSHTERASLVLRFRGIPRAA